MKITLCHEQTARAGTLEELKTALHDSEALVWVDMEGPSELDLQVMREVFNFHPLAIEDTRNQRQRPKIEEYPGYAFLIVNPVSIGENGQLEFRELDIFVGRNYVVTIHASAERVIDEAHRRTGYTTVNLTVGYLMYILLDVVVDGYFPIMDMVEEEISDLEDGILTRPRQEALNRVFELKRMLLHLWRVVWPQRDIMSNLTQPHHHLIAVANRDQVEFYLRDVADHLFWVADMVGTYRDTLTSVIDLYMSSVSNRLNRVVNRLTVITLGIGILSVITGFYGMNFTHTWPPTANYLGVPFVLLLVIVVTGVVVYALKWIDPK